MRIKQAVKKTRSILKFAKSLFKDSMYLASDVPISKEINHNNWQNYIVKLADKPGNRVLEVGSRVVVSNSMRKLFKHAEYVGFDYYPGENVDITGDAHKLSSYFDKKFDLIYSTAVFEHLAMPWIVSQEIVKLLNVGGYVFLETHYSYASHERPWHFFQFSENALKVLFNEKMGVKCILAGCSNPINACFSGQASEYLRYKPIGGMYCHSEFLGQKIKEVSDFNWYNCTTSEICNNSHYPTLNTI